MKWECSAARSGFDSLSTTIVEAKDAETARTLAARVLRVPVVNVVSVARWGR